MRPQSERHSDLQRFRRAGVRVGLGCDGQGNDLMATMRAALLIHGAVWGISRYEPDYLGADDVLAMATIDAARVLRWTTASARSSRARPRTS